MRAAINNVLDHLESVYSPAATNIDKQHICELIDMLQPVQDAYIEVIQSALRSLKRGDLDASHELLQYQRDQLATTLERIAHLIEQLAENDINPLKLIVEYLFTRARLVDELKMFPEFGLELLERLSLDESLDETIAYMEQVMTGKQALMDQILQYRSN